MNNVPNLPDNEFNKKLISKYNEVIEKHGDFDSIIWDRQRKDFVVKLKENKN